MKRLSLGLIVAAALFTGILICNSEEAGWMVDAPPGRGHGLFTASCLSDESCSDCLIGELKGGTKLKPNIRGCQEASWDSSYVYCHVRVLSGVHEGKVGWVNERFIDK